ncbi:hypothetical protein CAEBREN_18279 [Caenorhabditis brenneri]|uniref:Alpha/beta hydrolase fold-3 domain-containing protein n=1 Tax=Caenorhabditis brenneri TaxID=135651 RepID=G0PGX7_CAEBE|nr:hypothetical protein CAEBREN_18279 [Caenorhabditis brenneri]
MSELNEATRAFSPSCWVPGKTRDEVINEFVTEFKEAYDGLRTYAKLMREEDIPYGLEEQQKVDVWGEVKDRLFIFFHGGYWVEGDRKSCLTPALCALKSGYAFASVGYRLAKNGVTLTDSVEDAVKGVEFLLERYPSASTIVVGGHSAGALLAFHAVTRVRDTRIKGMALVAGCYFLEELVNTDIGKDIALTADQAQQNSCDVSKLNGLNLKNWAFIAYQEAPKLIEQNEKFVSESEETQAVKFSDLSHYTIMTKMMDPKTGVFMAMADFLSSF